MNIASLLLKEVRRQQQQQDARQIDTANNRLAKGIRWEGPSQRKEMLSKVKPFEPPKPKREGPPPDTWVLSIPRNRMGVDMTLDELMLPDAILVAQTPTGWLLLASGEFPVLRPLMDRLDSLLEDECFVAIRPSSRQHKLLIGLPAEFSLRVVEREYIRFIFPTTPYWGFDSCRFES